VGVASLVVLYLIRARVGEIYYDEIAGGLVPFTTAWWVVWTASVPYYVSIAAGVTGAIVMAVAARRLGRLLKSAAAATDRVSTSPERM
jgi:hypothetical protein